MEKKVLEQYIDACELIKETEKDIRRLKKKRQTIVQTNVSGSNPEFPYNPQHFKIAGTAFTYEEDSRLRRGENPGRAPGKRPAVEGRSGAVDEPHSAEDAADHQVQSLRGDELEPGGK